MKYLVEEWQEKKKSDVILYRKLNDFFSDHFPNIKLAAELEKSFTIAGLATSAAFATTHTIIAKLSNYADFLDEEVNSIVEAILANDQVHSIAKDVDVQAFIESLLKKYPNKIEEEKLEELKELIKPDEEDEVIPF